MQQLTFEFESEQDMRETVNKLWEGLGATGEMQIRPAGNGRWRVELNTEKELRESALEKFAAFRVEAGD